MFDRLHFALCADSGRYAVATDAETVEIWPFDPSSDRPAPAEPESRIETGLSPIRGLAFVAPERVLTVHQLGECVVWTIPDRETPRLEEEDAGTADVPAPSESGTDGADAEPPSSGGEQEALAQPKGEPPQRSTAPSRVPTAERHWAREIGVEITRVEVRARGGGPADRIAMGGRDGRLVLGVVRDGDQTHLEFGLTRAHEGDVTCLAFAPRSERLATGGRDDRIAVWGTNPDDFEAVSRDEKDSESAGPTEPPAADAATAETEGQAGEGSESPQEEPKTARAIEAPSIPRQFVLEGSKGWPLAIAFSGDGTRLASTALDNALYLWDPRAEEPLQAVVNRHDNWATALAWSPDDSHVATGSWDTTVGLFKTPDLAPQFRFEAHTDFVSAVAFVEKPARLVSASYDGTLAIWDWSAGELTDRIDAHADWIEILVGLGDSRVLTVSSEDVLRIWDISTGEKVAEIGDASFEGFDLGRAVDFTTYVDVPELSSDMLGSRDQSQIALDAVERMPPPGEEGSEGTSTAVDLLEDAVETSLHEDATTELASGASGSGKELLEARLEDSEQTEADAPSEAGAKAEPPADDSANREGGDGSKLPSPEAAGGPEPAGEDEVEEAFSEISEIDLGELKTPAGESGDASPEAGDPGEADVGAESVDQFGESIDERVGDASLDVPDEIDNPDQTSGTGSEPGPTDDGRSEETSLGSAPSPQLGSPVDEETDRPGTSTESRSRADDERSTDASPQLGSPADERSRDGGDVGGDTLQQASGGEGSVSGESHSTQFGVGPNTGSDSPGDSTGEERTGAEVPDAEDDESASAGEKGDSDEEGEPTAEALKEKFRQLKEQSDATDGSADSE